jgi:protein phosphatase
MSFINAVGMTRKKYEMEDIENVVEGFKLQDTNLAQEQGPFDIIGDIHGCLIELHELLAKLGYSPNAEGAYSHPQNRRIIFLGDLVNRGPDSVGVVQLVAKMLKTHTALYIRGNHCHYILGYFRKYKGKVYNRKRDWIEILDQKQLEEFGTLVEHTIGAAPPYLILDNGKLVVAHNGIEAEMIGKLSQTIFDFCLYGEETDEINAYGYKSRRDWAKTYSGSALVAHGHTPTFNISTPVIHNNTVNLDQACVFGGWLSAMRYPEKEFIQVKSHSNYTQKC